MKANTPPPLRLVLIDMLRQCRGTVAQCSALTRTIVLFVTMVFGIGGAHAQIIHTFTSANAAPPVTQAGYTASGTATLALGFAPTPGTSLMVVENTSLPFIQGCFTNLAHGDTIALTFGGTSYNFVANYYGGTGNDLVLEWATVRPVSWAYNSMGQLGNNSNVAVTVPVNVSLTGGLAGKVVLSLAVGGLHTLALTSDGKVYAWGYNADGELGNGTTTHSPVPVAVNMTGVLAGKRVVSIGAGTDFSIALCSDGTLVRWGASPTGNTSLPVLVSQTGALINKSVVAISAGSWHSLALCADGTLASWGFNFLGILGNGGSAHSTLPVLVDRSIHLLPTKNIASISAGSVHSLVLCSDNTLYAWGDNQYGQLGTGNAIGSNKPAPVVFAGALVGKVVTRIATGFQRSLVQCSLGSSTNQLVGWGLNWVGGLGDGTTTNSLVPVAVNQSGALLNKSITSISSGLNTNVVECADGTLSSWGAGGVGQLGNNTNAHSSLPVLVSNSPLGVGERYIKPRAGCSGDHVAALIASPTPPPGTVDPLDVGIDPNGEVFGAVPHMGGTIIYGNFTSVGNGQTWGPITRNNIFRLMPDNSLDASFNPNVNGVIYTCAVDAENRILIGGQIAGTATAARRYIARLNSNGSTDSSFDPDADFPVWSILVQRDGQILIGGNFTLMGSASTVPGTPSVACSYLARIDPVSGAATAFAESPDSAVYSMLQEASGGFLIGGRFLQYGSSGLKRLVRIGLSYGAVNASFNPNPNLEISCLALEASGRVFAGGPFTTIGGGNSDFRAWLNPATGSLATIVTPTPNAPISSAAMQTDGSILIGGSFTPASGYLQRSYFARLSSAGTLDSLNPAPNSHLGRGNVAVRSDGKIWVMGSFNSVTDPSGQVLPRRAIALLSNSPAVQNLNVPNTSAIQWMRSGTACEVEHVTFDWFDSNSSLWTPLGVGTRIAGGWSLTGLSLPTSGTIRARGRSTGSFGNNGSGLIEQELIYTAPTPPPDIVVKHDSTVTNLTSCVSTVSMGGTIVHTTTDQTFTICNTGLAPLTLSAITFTPTTPHYTVLNYTPGTLNPNQCTSFTVRFAPSVMGILQATLVIANNDPDVGESPFCIYLTGTGTCPEIDVQFPFGTSRVDGSSIPVNMGSNVPTCSTIDQTFYITNIGTSDLHLHPGILPPGVSYIDGPNAADFTVLTPAPVAIPAGPYQLMVRFSPRSSGTKTATLHILNDDANESSFDIKLTATAIGSEINVVAQSPVQVMQDNIGTLDLGCTLLGADLNRIIKVSNSGNAPLDVTSLTSTVPNTFSIGGLNGIPGITPPLGASFSIRFHANALGTFTGVVKIFSNDCDESHFDINVVAHVVTSLNPAFTSQLANKIVYVGAPVSFTAGIDVCAPATVKWWKNTTNVSTTALTHTAVSTSYNIAAAALTHGGYYKATATPGTATTNNANLTVVSPTVQCINKLAGQSITMTIQATSGNSMTYTWLKDGQLVSPQPNGPSLTLNNLTAANAGQFICQVQVPGSGMLPAGAINLSINGLYPMHSTIAGRYIAILDRGPNNDNLGGRIDITIQTNGCCVVTLRRGAAPAVTVIGAVSTTPNGGTYGSIKFPSIMGEVNFTIDPYLNPNRFMNDGIFGVSNLITPQGTSNFTGWRNVWGTNLAGAATSKYATSATVPGPYTMGLFSVAPGVPQGDGFASFSVLSNGTYSLSGETPIGDVFTTSNAFIGPDGDLAIFHVLPGGTGSIVGISRIALNNAANATDNEIVASSSYAPGITWSRIANVSPTLYPAGFAPVAVSVLGGYYGTAQVITSGSHPLNFLYAGLPSFYSPNRVVPVTTAASYSLPGLPTLPTTLTFGGTGAFNRAFISGKFEVIDTNPIAPCGPLLHRTPRSLANVQPFYRGIVIPMNQGTGRIGVGYFLLDQLPTTANTSAPKVTLSGAAVLQ